jgi:hypothetical protein
LQIGYFSDLIFLLATQKGPLIFLVFLQLWEGSLQYPRKISDGHVNQKGFRPGVMERWGDTRRKPTKKRSIHAVVCEYFEVACNSAIEHKIHF